MRVAMLGAVGETSFATAAEESAAGAIAIPCDVGDRERRSARWSAVVGEFGGAPDIIVNNAGHLRARRPSRPSTRTTFRARDRRQSRRAVPARAERSSRTCARESAGTSSRSDRSPIASAFPENGAYAASKFGLRALHEVLRAELRGSGVRATLVSPGPVDTALWDDDRTRRHGTGFTPRAQMLRRAPSPTRCAMRVSQPADVNVDELRLSRS